MRALLVPVAAVAGLLVWAELVHARASGRGLGALADGVPAVDAVVVLGFRNRGRRANLVNRFRVRAGLRSLDPRARRRVLVLCGGAVAGGVSEARVMADYARRRGYRGLIRLESTSASTRENIRNAIPILDEEHADAIAIVSDALHAAKGRGYLWQLRPDLAARLRRGREYRLGEALPMKVVTAMMHGTGP